jgi:hypothetical protein
MLSPNWNDANIVASELSSVQFAILLHGPIQVQSSVLAIIINFSFRFKVQFVRMFEYLGGEG